MRSRLLHMTVLFRHQTSFLASSAVKPEMFWEVSTTDCLDGSCFFLENGVGFSPCGDGSSFAVWTVLPLSSLLFV